jgi:hypothetical protein
VLPDAARIRAETADRLASFVENGGSVVVLGELAEQDPWNQSLPGEARSTIAGSATTLAKDAGAEEIRAAVEDASVTLPLSVTDPSGASIEHVEWRSARHDGRRIVNVANYNREAVTVQISRDGEAVSPRRELRAEESVSGTEIEIPRQTAKLFVLPE